MQSPVVVDERDGQIVALLAQHSRQFHAPGTGSVNDGGATYANPILQPLKIATHGKAGTADVEKRQQPEDDGHRPRKATQRHHVCHGRNDHGDDGRPLHDAPDRLAARMANHVAIQSQGTENRDAQQAADDERRPELGHVRIEFPESQGQGRPQRDGKHGEIRDYRNGLPLTPG